MAKSTPIYSILSIRDLKQAIAERETQGRLYLVLSGEVFHSKRLISKKGEKQANLDIS
jgi:hypothetical protein